MFRYVALAWDPANLACVATIKRAAQQVHMRPDWRTVMSRPGLSVFARGTKPNINSSYALSSDRGVVLGKLFRRRDVQALPTSDTALDPAESADILNSGGRALVDRYWGRYVAILDDAAERGTRVVRDPTGELPCYVVSHRGVWLIFSWLEDALAMVPGLPPPVVRWDYVSAYAAAGFLTGTDTAIDGVTQVMPGEAALLVDGTSKCRLYWNAADFARSPSDEGPGPSAVALRRAVQGCAKAWAECYENIMLRLSGGLDSSILVSCLARGNTGAQVTCINFHSAGSDTDERNYARLAAARAQRELIECERDSTIRLERILDVAKTPSPSYYVVRLDTGTVDADLAAAHGASALFTGGGGDQIFYQDSTPWTAADYLRLRGIDSGFATAVLDAARLGRVSVWKALRYALVDLVRFKAPNPYENVGANATLVHPDVVAATRRDVRFMHAAIRAAHRIPRAKLQQLYWLTFWPEYHDPIAQERAVEQVHPLLSQPVVELCLRLPTYVLTHGGRDRALARQAFADDLPSEIVRRRSKGGQEEHSKAILLGNLDFVKSMLLDGALVRRGVLNRARLEEVLSGRPTTIGSHVMELFLYLSIEAWLNRWSMGQQRAAA